MPPAFGPAVVLCMLLAAPANPAAEMSLQERIEQCAGCHGEDGNSRMENIPSLAGQPEFFVLNQLFLMREGVRKIEAMMPFVKDLKDDDLAGLAKHFAGLTPKPSDEKVDPALARRGGELVARMRCGSCHQPDLAGQQQMPRVAKQRVDYLIYSLKAYRDDQRTGADTLMSNVVAGMPDSDIAALAHYAASR
jgi:cytochrome c553